MEYISSDTNIWLDFMTINKLHLPFKLPYVYLMYEEAVRDELLNPPGLGESLVKSGLQETQLTDEEFFLTEKYIGTYMRLSRYDCIALSIAKARKLLLLTGDRALRKAADMEGVKVMGSIGILDQLLEGDNIIHEEYIDCIKRLLANNGRKVRLPKDELMRRLSKNDCSDKSY